jgi:hypothetical protein
MQHFRYPAATICSYHRLQHTQNDTVPLRATTYMTKTSQEYERWETVTRKKLKEKSLCIIS